MSEPVDALFDEFAAAFARGERPEVLGYLSRAGEGAGELAALIDAYLVVAVPPPPGEAARRRVRALIPEQTLRDLRTKAGVKRDRLVDEILAAFSIDPVKRKRVKNYYRELEAGLLDPAGVSPRVWALLGRLLSTDPSVLVDAARPAPITQSAFLSSEVAMKAAAPAPAQADESDDVDRLFLGGR
jgi:hypothetical protein